MNPSKDSAGNAGYKCHAADSVELLENMPLAQA